MRGGDKRTGELFSYVDLEKRVRLDHPLRAIRGLVNEALVALEDEFSALYASIGRPSIPPEKLLRAMLLQAFYSIRSERQLMERLEYDLLFRWFVGIGVDAAVWDHSVFSKNRDRLLEGDIATRFLAAVLDQPRVKKLLSTEHFTVDGTLIEAWASLKSFKPRDGSDDPPAGGGRNAEADFHGKKRSNGSGGRRAQLDQREHQVLIVVRHGHPKPVQTCRNPALPPYSPVSTTRPSRASTIGGKRPERRVVVKLVVPPVLQRAVGVDARLVRERVAADPGPGGRQRLPERVRRPPTEPPGPGSDRPDLRSPPARGPR